MFSQQDSTSTTTVGLFQSHLPHMHRNSSLAAILHRFANLYIISLACKYGCHAIVVHITRVNLEDYGTKVGSVRYSPVNLGGRDSTKSVNSTILRILQSTVVYMYYLNLRRNLLDQKDIHFHPDIRLKASLKQTKM